MGCFPCSGDHRTRREHDRRKKSPAKKSLDISKSSEKLMREVAEEPREYGPTPNDNSPPRPSSDAGSNGAKDDSHPRPNSDASPNAAKDDSPPRPSSTSNTLNSQARKFTLAELVTATENFNADYFLGEGGFGKVYKGRLQDTNEIVAIKRLDRNGCQGIREFVVEVVTLGNASHPNLVKLIGYCAEGDQRLLVYEYMPLRSLEDHLHGSRQNKKLLDWNTRIKIVAGAAEGLEYLHNKMDPPVIYRDLKCSNILLGQGYFPKLSDFGLAKVGPCGDQTHVSTRVMGTYGYCAPDYAMTGQLTFKSDIYSFGVVLLEIISGRKAIDPRRNGPEQKLVEWAKPLFKDRKKFYRMVDPLLEGQYPMRGLYQVLAISAMCIQDQPNLRPAITDIVSALKYLASQKYEPRIRPIPSRRDLSEGKEERCGSSGNEDERVK